MSPESTEVTFCVRGVISPLLANIYLHYVFDLWVDAWRKKCAQGDVVVVRDVRRQTPRNVASILGSARESGLRDAQVSASSSSRVMCS